MTERWPKIKARSTTSVSPWMSIIEREVEFSPDAERELYHAVAQRDYIAIVAALPDGRIPIVRQYRPELSIRTKMRPRAAAVNSWKRPVSQPELSIRLALTRHAPLGYRTSCIRSTSRLVQRL